MGCWLIDLTVDERVPEPVLSVGLIGPPGAISGWVLIYIRKEQMQGTLQRYDPARHDVMVNDKLR